MAKNRKGPGCFFLLTIPFTLLVLILLVILGGFYFIKKDYDTWNEKFDGQHLSNDYLVIDKSEDLQDEIDFKIEEFDASQEEVDFIELTTDEVLYVFGSQLSDSLPYGVEVERLIVEPNTNDWEVYIQMAYKNNRFPWMRVNIEKDDIETAELYISEMFVGPYDLDEWVGVDVRTSINKGLSDALILVNENDFSGRTFENIELEEDGVVVKGSL